MTEQDIQTKIKEKLERDGWMVIKLISCSISGMPDLLCLKNGLAKFIEVKKESGVLSPIQKHRIKELIKKGFECNVWIDYENNFNKK